MLKEKTKNNVIKSIANTVEADATFRPHFEEDAKRSPKTYSNLNSKAGITLIALIITIIVMLILVGVTISVALNGGLFNKAESAVTQTKIEQVKEALEIKKAEILADNNGEKPEGGYNNLNIDHLDIPDSLKNEYRDKLIVGTDGNLYYDPAVVTDAKEQDELKAHGINEFNSEKSYTFTLEELVNKGGTPNGDGIVISSEDFWTDDISEELRNSGKPGKFDGQDCVSYNITCDNDSTLHYCDPSTSESSDYEYDKFFLFFETPDDGQILLLILLDDGSNVTNENWHEYKDLQFTIRMPE